MVLAIFRPDISCPAKQDSERFISLILSEPFDYTEWQKDLYGDMSLDEFYNKVKASRSDTRMA
ncbi:MAG: hypothetical protein LBH25_10235 [Fibromonadaceae bacterium]|jgi:hypothetical protein|nr:hypothetical protein [Fibromonadaceae bacterium]